MTPKSSANRVTSRHRLGWLLVAILLILIFNRIEREAGMTPRTETESRWNPPFPYGYPEAIDNVGSISAPLLAGINIALAAVLLTTPAAFPRLHVALFLLVLATAALVAAVQFTYQARQFVVKPDELEAWWPNHNELEQRLILRRIQRYHRRRFGTWAWRARAAYNLGILAFASGVTAILAPRHISHQSLGKLAPAGLAAAMFVAEFLWVLWTTFHTPVIRNWPEVLPESEPTQRA